jgi:hypothetical protein
MNIPVEAARPLRAWLTANALFSGTSGAGIAIASGSLPGILGAGGRMLYVIMGAMLCLYGLRLWWLSRRPLDPREVRVIIGADALWVGSIVVVVTGTLTPVGDLLVGAVAVVVGALAVGQAASLRQSKSLVPTPVESSGRIP